MKQKSTYVLLRVVFSGQTDKDLLCIPIEKRREIGIDIKVDLDKILNVSIHMPSRFPPDDFQLVDNDSAGRFVRGEMGDVDKGYEEEDDGGCQSGNGVEPREGAMHCAYTSLRGDAKRRVGSKRW